MDKYTLVLENLYDLYRTTAKVNHLNHGIETGFEWVKREQNLWPNIVFNINNSDCNAEPFALLDRVNSETIPSKLLLPENIEGHLFQKNGFKPLTRWQAFICESSGFNLNYNEQVDPLITIKKLTTSSDIQQWVELVNKVLKSGLIACEIENLLCTTNAITILGAYYNNILITTILLYENEHSIGMYFLATDIEFRSLGSARSIFETAIKNRLVLGNKKPYVGHATMMSSKMCAKFGFQNVGNIDIYWKVGIKYS